jgi:phospholipid/cholesterol/gamma-HCH transport system substrate-binding protein
MRTPPYHLIGVGMVAAVVAVVTVSLLLFNQVFTPTVNVSVHISRAGLQLLPGSDVKVRGIIAGQVHDITSDGDGAQLRLRLDPSMAKRLPDNVSVRLVPKTVFGEKYVDLQLPDDPSPRHLRNGSVIPEDRSQAALEIDEALNDLLPMLRTVQPGQLNQTLTALATALSGRGEQLGQTIVALRDYLRGVQPHLPALQHDLTALVGVTRTYDEAADALLRMMRNFSTTAETVVAEKAQLSAFLDDMTNASNATRDLIARNATDIVQVNAVSRPVLALLARYSPEYPCFFKGYQGLIPRIHDAVSKKPGINHSAHVVVEFVPSFPTYQNPIDLPEFKDDRGPNCYGLPNPPMSLPVIQFKDGTEDDPRFQQHALQLNRLLNQRGAVSPSSYSPEMGSAGTPEERRAFNTLLGPLLLTSSTDVPDIADLLWGPMARGTGVRLS